MICHPVAADAGSIGFWKNRWQQRSPGIDIENVIASYGLAAVFTGTFLEGETVAITGGVLAHRNLLVMWQVIAAAGAGALLSDLIFYYLGHRYRTHRVTRRIMARPKFKRVMAQLDKSPSVFAAGFRFVPGMRIVGPIALAQSQITAGRFVALAGVSALIWAAFYCVMGHAIGHLIALLIGDVGRVETLLIVPGAVLACLAAYAIWRSARRRAVGRGAAR